MNVATYQSPETEVTGPKFSFQDILGDDASLQSICDKVTKRIVKMGWRLREFEKKPLFNLQFPPERPNFLENIQFLYYGGETAFNVLTDHNDLNRSVTLNNIIEYASMMLAYNPGDEDGSVEWKEKTLEGITFSRPIPREGSELVELQNGQHRLLALYVASHINPDVVVGFVTLFNADPKNINYIDNGANRETHDKIIMEFKRAGRVFENDRYKGIRVKDIKTVIKAMPNNGSMTENHIIEYAKRHFDVVVDFLKVLMNVRTIRYKSSWAGPFINAAVLFGPENVMPMAHAFANNDWIIYDEPNRVDPLFSLFTRLVADTNARSSNKIRADGVKAMAMYAIRKRLLNESVSEKRGARYLARHVRFSAEEVEDYAVYGADSKVLKDRSVARKSAK